MRKRVELIIILAIMVIIVMLGLWHVISTSLLNPFSVSQVMISPMTSVKYNNDQYGFSFSYPYGYLLTEKSSTAEQKQYHISLIRKEDSLPITNGEGPRSIDVDIYAGTSSISDWLQTPESNFHLGDGTYATTTINNLPVVRYKWEGLYQGETLAFEYLGNIIAFSVTFDSSNDQIRKDFEETISSLKLKDRLLTEAEAVKLIKDSFPELQSYSSNNLPPTSIKTEEDKDGWNAAFLINGSGAAYILGAKCYQVKNDEEVLPKGEYKFDSNSPYKPANIDIKTCRPLYQNVADYVTGNLSKLSSQKEVLGGKFYATSLEIASTTGAISYEDGHNAYKAHFSWTEGSDGRIAIPSFSIDR